VIECAENYFDEFCGDVNFTIGMPVSPVINPPGLKDTFAVDATITIVLEVVPDPLPPYANETHDDNTTCIAFVYTTYYYDNGTVVTSAKTEQLSWITDTTCQVVNVTSPYGFLEPGVYPNNYTTPVVAASMPQPTFFTGNEVPSQESPDRRRRKVDDREESVLSASFTSRDELLSFMEANSHHDTLKKALPHIRETTRPKRDSTHPITALPSCSTQDPITYAHVTLDCRTPSDPGDPYCSSAFVIEYAHNSVYTCSAYTTCGTPFYPNVANVQVGQEFRCWAMYCDAHVGDPSTANTISCYYDNGQGGVKLSAPYSIYDVTAFGIFDWRYRPSLAAGKRVSFVNGVENQAACGSCWDFAATTTFESRVSRTYNLFLDSKLVIPQLTNGQFQYSVYATSDLSEQNVLDYEKPFDECNHGGGYVSGGSDAFVHHGGMPYSLETYPAYNNATYGYMGNQFNSKARERYHAYNPFATGYKDFSPKGDTNLIKSTLRTQGPLYSSVCVGSCNQFEYNTGLGMVDNASFAGSACNNNCGDHAVTLVGYGTQYHIQCIEYYWILINLLFFISHTLQSSHIPIFKPIHLTTSNLTSTTLKHHV